MSAKAQQGLREVASGVRERQVGAIGASWTALATRFGLAALFGVFLAVCGVGTAIHGPFWLRAVSVSAVSVTGVAVGSALIWMTRNWRGSRWMRVLTISLVMTTPLGLFVWVLDILVAKPAPSIDRLPSYMLTSLAISLLMGLLFWLGLGRPLQPGSPAPWNVPSPFLDRLPPRLRGSDLWAVQAEDHYLRVHTSKGQDLILMRLSDAMAELKPIEGAQTHRSWWVARAAISDVAKGDGRGEIRLPDGVMAPVSRTHAKALRERGWI
jgi:hypothetical protein